MSFLRFSEEGIWLDKIADRIMAGDSFQRDPIPASNNIIGTAEHRGSCNPLAARAAAIIRLRLFEDAVASSDTHLIDERLIALRSSVDLALSCVPAEGFLWFIRYWSAIQSGSHATDHFDELRMSYKLAPREGWSVLRRNPYVLAIYDSLPSDIKEMAANEFVSIAASGFINDAANILLASGWPVREQLLPPLRAASLDARIAFSKALQRRGLTVQIPGVVPDEFRPWR
jgi:hypothetical protein